MTDARDDPGIGVVILTGAFLLYAASNPLEAPDLWRALIYGSVSCQQV